MKVKKLTIIDSIKFGFTKTIEYFGILFLAQLLRWGIWFLGYASLVLFISGGIMPFRMMIYERGFYPVTNSFSLAIISLIIMGVIIIEAIDSALSLGTMQLMINIYDKKNIQFPVLFTKWHLVINNFILSLLLRVILFLGIICLVIPGIYLAIRFGFAYQVLVDKEVSPLEALHMSYDITQGAWFQLFGMWLIFLLINMAGAGCFLLGLLITIPTSFLAYVYAYRMLS